MDEDEVLFMLDGKEHCDEGAALSALLKAEVVFPHAAQPFFVSSGTVQISVLCSDLFAWGCADCESLPFAEVGALYKAWKVDPKHGVSKWCCVKRNERPQAPIERRWRAEGVWDDTMESLPENAFEKYRRESAENHRVTSH